MTNRKLIVLGIIATALVVIAVFQARLAKTKSFTTAAESILIQGLDTAKIASITVAAGDDQLILARLAEGFAVATKDNYPAKTLQINDLLAKCLDVKTVDHITANPQNHSDLGVAEENARFVVKFLDSQTEPITGIIVSNANEQGKTYVRQISSDDVYLAADSIWLQTDPMNYIEKQLTKIDTEKISSVTLTTPEGTYTLKKQKDTGQIVLENVPEGKKLKGSDYKQVFNALAGLNIDDVQKKSKAQGLNFDTKYLCALEDLTVYTLSLAKKDDDNYLTATAKYTGAKITKDRTVESEEELKAKEAKLLTKKAANDFAEKHTGWIYKIPQYKAGNLTKKLTDLLEDIEEPKPEETTPEKPKEEQPATLESDEPKPTTSLTEL
jgi:hypothetical protein